MAQMHPAPAPDPNPAWERLAAHRDDLLAIASRRASSPEAAEDAVQEALARAVARWHLIDPEQLGAWLAVVTMNLCADDHRLRTRERRVLPRLHQAHSTDPADVVTSRLEDAWVVAQVGELPDRQRQVLHAVADEGGVPAAADRLGVSRQSAESMLKRARATVRARFAVTLGALGLAGWRRGTRVGAATGGAAASLAAVSLGLIATVPGVHGQPPAPHVQHPNHGHGSINTLRATTSADAHRVRRTAPSRSALRRAGALHPGVRAHQTPERVVLPARDYNVGPAHYHDGGAGFEDRDETFAETIQRCIDKGVAVSTTYVGCRRPSA